MSLKRNLTYFYNILGPHFPFYEWDKINKDLDKKYNEYGINDKSQYGKNVKNSARHFTGGALGDRYYGENITNFLGNFKEVYDDVLNNLNIQKHSPEDTNIDFLNNQRGIIFNKKYPDVNRNSVYDAAIKYAIKNYTNDYGVTDN